MAATVKPATPEEEKKRQEAQIIANQQAAQQRTQQTQAQQAALQPSINGFQTGLIDPNSAFATTPYTRFPTQAATSIQGTPTMPSQVGAATAFQQSPMTLGPTPAGLQSGQSASFAGPIQSGQLPQQDASVPQAVPRQITSPFTYQFSPQQTIQRIDGGAPTGSQVPFSWAGGAQRSPSELRTELNTYYRQNQTSEDVKNRAVENAQAYGDQMRNYWSALENLGPEKGGGMKMVWEKQEQVKQAQAAGMSDKQIRESILTPIVTPDGRTYEYPSWSSFNTQAGTQGTDIVQPDGRRDSFRPGQGYTGSMFTGESLKQARDIYEKQRTGLEPPIPNDVTQIMTDASGKVIGWSNGKVPASFAQTPKTPSPNAPATTGGAQASEQSLPSVAQMEAAKTPYQRRREKEVADAKSSYDFFSRMAEKEAQEAFANGRTKDGYQSAIKARQYQQAAQTGRFSDVVQTEFGNFRPSSMGGFVPVYMPMGQMGGFGFGGGFGGNAPVFGMGAPVAPRSEASDQNTTENQESEQARSERIKKASQPVGVADGQWRPAQ